MKKKKSKSAVKKRSAFESLLNSRKATMMFSLLVIVLVIVNIVVISYSWFTPESQKATGINFSTTVEFRSENCEIKQYTGAYDNGTLTYTELAAASYSQTLDGGQDGATYYFQTEITNNDNAYPTIVSLFFNQFPTAWGNNQTFNGLGFGVQEPSNNYRTYNTTQSPDFYIIRNAYLAKNEGHNQDASLSVRWFVKIPANRSITLNLADMYLTYN